MTRQYEYFWVAMVAIYWIGVFTGTLSHVHYDNWNMDTWLHGGFVTWGSAYAIRTVRGWLKGRMIVAKGVAK